MTEEELTRITHNMAIHGLIPEDMRNTTDPVLIASAIEAFGRRFKELEPQAADGRAYRTDLIANALREGVRAYGNEFKKEMYEETLASARLETIKQYAADWQKVADAALPSGRQTVDDDRTPEQTVKPKSFVPDAAYAA